MGEVLAGLLVGGVAWFAVVHVLRGFFTVNQNERAVKTSFGRAHRLTSTTLDNPMGQHLRPDERERYRYPQVEVITPGGPYFRWPWEQVHKVTVATRTENLAVDFEDPRANAGGRELDAVTKDQLNISLVGQIRYRVSEQNLYAYLFGVKRPIVHVFGYFVSILRQHIASFEAPAAGNELPQLSPGSSLALPPGLAGGQGGPGASELSRAAGISINDLRKNLRLLNETMDAECRSSTARYGIILDASLITGIDPPSEVESALAAINTAHNMVGAEVSLAQAAADQKLVQSRRAVEIEMLHAQAEVEPLLKLSEQLADLKRQGGSGVLEAYIRNVKLTLYSRAKQAILEVFK